MTVSEEIIALADDMLHVAGACVSRQDICEMLEAVVPLIADAERKRWSVTECPTECDDDCELRPDGCHEEHQPSHMRAHQPWACQEAREAVGLAVAAERERLREAFERIQELAGAAQKIEVARAVIAERMRIADLASELRAAFPADHPQGTMASFADYIRTHGGEKL